MNSYYQFITGKYRYISKQSITFVCCVQSIKNMNENNLDEIQKIIYNLPKEVILRIYWYLYEPIYPLNSLIFQNYFTNIDHITNKNSIPRSINNWALNKYRNCEDDIKVYDYIFFNFFLQFGMLMFNPTQKKFRINLSRLDDKLICDECENKYNNIYLNSELDSDSDSEMKVISENYEYINNEFQLGSIDTNININTNINKTNCNNKRIKFEEKSCSHLFSLSKGEIVYILLYLYFSALRNFTLTRQGYIALLHCNSYENLITGKIYYGDFSVTKVLYYIRDIENKVAESKYSNDFTSFMNNNIDIFNSTKNFFDKYI